jgi:large subunit ribosomal protein L3
LLLSGRGWEGRNKQNVSNSGAAKVVAPVKQILLRMALTNRSQREVLKMTMGLVGRKCGMTRVFTDDGVSIPVTVVEAQPNRITQVKTVETDGYRALQVVAGSRKASRVVKPAAGHFAAAKVEAGDLITEFRIADSDETEYQIGSELRVELFDEGQKVDVIGTSIGKGFAGTVKRHNFSMQDATHGNSLAHRAPGSIGQNQTPGRVFKGKKMSGQMGNVRRTVQNLEVVRVDNERNLLLIKGAVPGHRGGSVIVRPAVKARKQEAH